MTRGTTVIVQPGLRNGADAAFPPPPETWDFEWMGRYVSTNEKNPKNLTSGEIDRIADADHDKGIAYFVEQAETTPINSTLEDDKTLAAMAVKLATRWGLPKDCPFWYAVDVAPFAYMPQIIEAFRVYRDMSAGWPVAAYIGSQGGEQLMDLGLIDYFHIPAALSWSSTSAPVDNVTVFKIPGSSSRWYKSPLASILQHPSEPFAGSRIDRNDTLLPTPMWFPGREHVDPQEDDMTPEQAGHIDAQFKAIWEVLTQPISSIVDANGVPIDHGMQWNLALLKDHIIDKNHLVDRIVAALPAGGAGELTSQQVTDAVLVALRQGTG